jgi:hypothetical protein
MATQPTPAAHPAQPPTKDTTARGPGVLDPWHAHRADRKQARLISPRNRRVLARWLRRTANHTERPRPRLRTHEPLLAYRAAAVRTDLLEIATLLEHTHYPDPASIAALRNLLANGCDSPLYNTDIHISELHATLHYIRSSL